MSISDITSSELLLGNLADHQVIRIDGSAQWMREMTDQVKQFQPDYVEFEGSVELNSIQEKLAFYLSVENDASFIQQALKRRLEENRKLIVIVNADTVETEGLTYLLGLPSICNETGSVVTVILLSTSSLVSALKSSTNLAGKLDGYYQEEKENVVAVGGTKSAALIIPVILLITIAGGYLFYSSSAPETESSVATRTGIPAKELMPEPDEREKPSIPPSIVSEKALAEPEKLTTKVNEKTVPDNINRTLMNDLAQTVEQAKEKRDGRTKNLVADVEKNKESESQERSEMTAKQTRISEEEKVRHDRNGHSDSLKVVNVREGEKVVDNVVVRDEGTTVIYPSVTHLNNEAEVRKVIKRWSQSWEEQNWEGYINSYLQNTTLYGVKTSLEEWREFRKKRLLSPAWIKLELGTPSYTRLNTHWYRVEFYQRFEKPGYADETTKRLELTLTSSGWKIASEAANGTIRLK